MRKLYILVFYLFSVKWKFGLFDSWQALDLWLRCSQNSWTILNSLRDEKVNLLTVFGQLIAQYIMLDNKNEWNWRSCCPWTKLEMVLTGPWGGSFGDCGRDRSTWICILSRQDCGCPMGHGSKDQLPSRISRCLWFTSLWQCPCW